MTARKPDEFGMKTTKEQRKSLKIYLSQFTVTSAKEAVNAIEDLDRLEAQSKKLRLAIRAIGREAARMETQWNEGGASGNADTFRWIKDTALAALSAQSEGSEIDGEV